MPVTDFVARVLRQNRLVLVIGKLVIMAQYDGAEFDSLLLRILKRIETYEKGESRIYGKAVFNE